VPKIKSAKKRVQIAERNRLRNKSWRSAVRTVRTEVDDSVKAAKVKVASTALQRAYQVIDKAVAKGVLHRNTAARKKSRLALQVVRLSTTKKRKTKSTA
jgi:small subunit ribosomal protein S20